MAKGDGSYNNPIVVDGLIKKDGKIYKLNTGNTKDCVKSVNNIKPDDNGNVVVPELDKTDIENSITEIKKKNAEQDTALSQAKQELSDKCDTTLSSAKTYADGKANDALTNAKNYTDTEKQKYIPLTGTISLGPCNILSPATGQDARVTIGANEIRNNKPFYNSWRTGGLEVLSAGTSERLGTCQWFASRKINNESDDRDSNFYTTSLTLRPTGELEKSISLAGKALGYFTVETQRIQNSDGQTCILYENGWCLQCGRAFVPNNLNYATVNLLTPFKDTDYVVFCMARDPDDNNIPAIASSNYNAKTTTSFHIVSSFLQNNSPTWEKSSPEWGIDWLALGFVS